MIKCALISSHPLQLDCDEFKLKVFSDYKALLNKKFSFDAIFYFNNKNNFLNVYHELEELFDNLIFIVIYENIDIDRIKKGFKEGIYEFVSKEEFLKNFKLIFEKVAEHVKILRSKEKVFQYTVHNIFIEIPSDINLVNETVLQVITTAKVSGFIKNKKFENNIRLALTEGLVNAIVHGNKSDKNKNVELNVSINFKKMEISIKDMGKGFELNTEKIDPLNGENLLKSHGRGIYLMKILMDEVKYLKEKNELILIKYRENRKT